MTSTEDLPKADTVGIFFRPESWSALEKFSKFIGAPYTITNELVIGIRGAEGHLRKFRTLANLVNRLRETLAEDLDELNKYGYTPASRSQEFAALVEVLICELYSCLDGMRRVLFSVYRGIRGVQNKSTEKLFARAYDNKYDPEFPEEIRSLLAASFPTWFRELRLFRSEVTHGDVGSCNFDASTGLVSYSHLQNLDPEMSGVENDKPLSERTRSFVIPDIIDKLNFFHKSVFGLTEAVSLFLYEGLDTTERQMDCCVYKMHLYERYVAPGPNLSFASGRCLSRVWFEEKPGYECPMRQRCGAYHQGEP